MTQQAHPLYDVPAGTKPARCRGRDCGARIYWCIDTGGRKIPADCSATWGGSPPSERADPKQGDIFGQVTPIHEGRGIHHRRVCPNAEDFD